MKVLSFYMFSFLSGFISSKEPQTQHIPESIPKHEPGSKQNKPQTDPQGLKHTLSGSESSENDLAIEIDVRERELVLKEPIFHNGYKYSKFLQMTQTYQVRVIKNPGPVLHSLYVWAHPNLIKYLKYGLKPYTDGTFKCVPGGFKQLLILMVFEPNSKEYVPVIYGLAMDKTECTYKHFFKLVDIICEGEWNPSEVTTDFEKGLRNAVCGIY